MRRFVRTIVLAVTLVIGLVITAYYTWYMRQEDLKEWTRIRVQMEDVGGLKKKDPVFVNGARVGRVGEIQLFEDRQLVILEIEPDTATKLHLKDKAGKQVVAEVVPTSALGTVAIDLPPGHPSQPRLDPEQDMIQGKIRASLGGDTKPRAIRLREMRENFAGLERDTLEMTKPTGGTIGGLTADPERARLLAEGMKALAKSTARLDAALAQVERGERASILTSEDSILTLNNTLEAIASTLIGLKDDLRKVERGEGGAGQAFADRNFAAAWRDAITWQRKFWRDARQGKGTMGALVDPRGTTYSSLLQPLRNADAITTEARQGQGMLGSLSSAEMGENAREALRGLKASTDRAKTSGLVRDSRAREQLEDDLGNMDDFLIKIRNALRGVRSGLPDKFYQGAVFAVF